MKILLSGGGTAGHINPALAIAMAAMEHNPQNEILFIGRKGNMEEKLVKKEGYPIELIEVEGFKRKLTLHNITVAYKAMTAIFECKKIMKKFKPDVVICTGGYVSGPVMSAAHLLKIPAIIHEQNVYPGVTVKMCEKNAAFVATSFEKTAELLKDKSKCVLTGNPIRSDVVEADREKAREALGIGDEPFVLSFGGSLGATRVNESVAGYIKDIVANGKKVSVLFGTGTRNYDEVMRKFEDDGINLAKYSNITVTDYIYNMAEVMSAADVVISRAGAISISEIMAQGKASILIPSPNVAHNHQETNARLLESNGAAVVILERELTVSKLVEEIEKIIYLPERQRELERKAMSMAKYDAAKEIYELALKCVEK